MLTPFASQTPLIQVVMELSVALEARRRTSANHHRRPRAHGWPSRA